MNNYPLTSLPPATPSEPLKYVPHADFPLWAKSPGLESAVLGPMPEAPEAAASEAPCDVPPYLASLYEIPVLTREQETHLFRKLNYLKYKANLLRQSPGTLDPAAAAGDELGGLLGEIVATRQQIVCANLRLVVWVVKRHVRRAEDFFELISDGNLALIQAVEHFDFALGNRFSTYATRVINNSFTHSIPEGQRWQSLHRTDRAELFSVTADARSDPYALEAAHSRRAMLLESIMERLDRREREVICCRFALGRTQERMTVEQIGSRLGVSKARVCQLEERAMEKLRKALGQECVARPRQVEATCNCRVAGRRG
jgi:RNA polymerase sigma factor (sigma-70 family)